MAAKFLIQGGIQFSPKDIDTKAIRQAISNSVATSKLSVTRAVFSRQSKETLKESFATIAFQISKAKFNQQAKTSLRDDFQSIAFAIGKAKFSQSAKNQLRSEFSGIPFTLNNLRIGAKAQRVLGGTTAGAARGAAAGTTAAATGAATGAATQGASAATVAQNAVQSFRNQSIALRAVLDNTTAAERGTQNYLRLLAQGGTSAEAFGAKIAQITTRFTAYLISLKAIFAVQQAFNNSLKVIFDFDSSLQDLQKVLNETPKGLENISRGLFQVAQATGQAVSGAAQTFGVFIRAGLDVEESLKRTQAALIAANVTELNVEESTQFVTAALQVFKDELSSATEAIDLLSVAGDNAATTAGEIARAFFRSASSAKTSGVSFKELNALLAATIEQTQLGGSQVGTAFKTTFSRIIANGQALRTQANALGANIKAGDSLFDVFRKLAEIFPRLSREQKTQIGLTVAGQRQQNIIVAAINNFAKAQELVRKQADSSGVAFRKNEAELAKLSTRAQQVRNTFSELVVAIAGVGAGEEGIGSIRDGLGSIIDTTNVVGQTFLSIVNIVKNLSDGILGIDSILKALTKAGFLLVGRQLITGIISGFKTFIGVTGNLATVLNSLIPTHQAINQQIVQSNTLTQQGVNLTNAQNQALQTQLNTTTRLAQQIKNIRAAQGGGAVFASQITRSSANPPGRGAALGRAAAGSAALIGIQLLSDGARKLSKEFEELASETNSITDTINASFTSAAANGLEIGSIFGLLLGPARGLSLGLAAAALEIGKFAVTLDSNNTKLRDTIGDITGRDLTLRQATTEGGQFARKAFIELVGSLEDARKSIANESAIFPRALNLASSELKKFTNRFGTIVEQAAKSADGLNRSLELTSAIRTASEGVARRRTELQFDIDTGDLGKEFEGFKKLSAEIRVELERFVGPIKNAQDFSNGLAKAQKAVQQSVEEIHTPTSEILQDNLLISQEIQLINEEYNKLKRNIDAAKESGAQQVLEAQKLDQQVEQVQKRIQELKELQDKQTGSVQAVTDLEKELVSLGKQREGLSSELRRFKQQEQEAEETLVKFEEQRNKVFDEEIKKITEIVSKFSNITEEAKIASLEIRVQNAALEKQNALALESLSAKRTIAQLSVTANTLEEQAAANRAQIEEKLQSQIQATQNLRIRQIQALEREELAAQAARDQGRAQEIKEAREQLQVAAGEELAVLREKARIEIETELINQAQKQLEQSEAALRDFRLSAIRQAAEAEQRAFSERLKLIKEFGQTSAGRDFLQDNFRTSDTAQREFGLVGSIIVKELTNSTNRAIQSMVAEIDQLRTNGQISFRELQLAEAERARRVKEVADLERSGANLQELRDARQSLDAINVKIEEITRGGANSFDILKIAQERSAQAIELLEEETRSKRELILERLKTASEKASDAEKNLIDARNELPQLNAKVIEAEKAVATSSAEVEKTAKALIDSYQELSDAQFRLNAEIALGAFAAKQAAGTIGGTQAAIFELKSVLSELESGIKASGEALLEVRRQILQEELNLVKTQLQAVRGLALEAATAEPDQIARIQQQISAAQAIAGGASTSQFPPELLQGIERLFPVIEGLEEQILRQGAARLGLDPSIFQGFEDKLVDLSTSIAETGQTQVNQAAAQVIAAQQQLAEAQEQRRITEQQLQISSGIRDAAVSNVQQAVANLAVTRSGFGELTRQTNRQLEQLKEGVISNKEGQILLSKLLEIQQFSQKDIQTQAQKAEEQLGLTKEQTVIADAVKEEVVRVSSEQKQTNTILTRIGDNFNTGLSNLGDRIAELGGAILRITSSVVSVPNNARGSLSGGEISGLISAAQREKRGMPANSSLMLANTSEVVLTRNQAKRIGIKPRAIPFAQEGNADVGGLQNIVNALTSIANSLNNKISDKSTFQNNINVQINSDDNINVRGLDGIESAVRQAFEQRAAGFATNEKVRAIESIVTSIVQKLNENGIINSIGS